MSTIMKPKKELDKKTVYTSFCDTMDIEPVGNTINISSYSMKEYFSQTNKNERLTAALIVLTELMKDDSEPSSTKFNKYAIDGLIHNIDSLLSQQMDEILHHPDFQELESLWRGLHQLTQQIDGQHNTYLSVLSVSKDDLMENFEEATDTSKSGLYHQVYQKEYDTPGGIPFSAMISNYEFSHTTQDINLLNQIAKVATLAHCPFLGNVGAEFFAKKDMDEVAKISDLQDYLSRAEFIRWNALRKNENSRYLGLTMPHLLMRTPYDENSRVRSFNYLENVKGQHKNFLWGSAAFAFGANLCRSFKNHGWAVGIRGPESGGRVSDMMIYQPKTHALSQVKIPTEILIPESRELELAEAGFIPLSYYKGSDFACFFSANSVHKPEIFYSSDTTANSRINARLPYIFLASRLGHYLKVIQRENIGNTLDRMTLEQALNNWINTLVTAMPNPGPELISKRPLRAGSVRVRNNEENPGYFQIELQAMPHFQVEGIDIRLSLKAQLPGENNQLIK